ncbi:unnamed protein product [Moneuplotes crassus]|uniref:Uncharacterized protein n=1 Tax=Euplotes crassus TaxID=5936 RepID=A0AAD1XVR4_EUPCR|nr:unnamed protein product [Moneuplotes crassus]
MSKRILEEGVRKQEKKISHEMMRAMLSRGNVDTYTNQKRGYLFEPKYFRRGNRNTRKLFPMEEVSLEETRLSRFHMIRKFLNDYGNVQRISEFRIILNPSSANLWMRVSKLTLKIFPNVINTLKLSHCALIDSSLRKVFQAGRHISYIILSSCRIRFTTFTLSSGINYQTKFIQFLMKDLEEASYWEQNKDKLCLIFNSISNTNLKHSLQKLFIDIPSLKEHCQHWQEKYQLKKIKIVKLE